MNVRYDMVTCFVVRPDASGRPGELLQLRRAKGEFLEGVWGPVHGRIQRAESAWQAALRELREETTLTPLEFYQLDTINQFYLVAGDCVWHVPGFCAVVGRDASITLNEEHDGFRWIDRERIDHDFLWPGERRQAEELVREILNDGPSKPFLRISL